MPVSFVLLVAAIAAVWLPSRSQRRWPIPFWIPVYAASLVAAVAQGYVMPVACVALLVLIASTEVIRRGARPCVYWPAFALVLLLTLALALHKVPGFRNPIAINAVQFSGDAIAFTQYLNFDKGSAGLVLLALLAPRLRQGDPIGSTLARAAALSMGIAIIVLGVALVAGMVRVDPKWPPQAVLFLVVNLFFTCVAEETFFRVMIQDALVGSRADSDAKASGPRDGRALLSIVGTAMLFAVAHAGGGARMVVVAGVAGLGYAAAYAWRRRIEVPIVMHFGVNAVHFLLFSYPALRS